MTRIDGTDKISIMTEPVFDRVQRRDPTFANRIKEAVADVNDKQHIAGEAKQKAVKGEMGIHEAMIAGSKADTSLRFLTAVRGKVMEAYKTVIRMPV